MVQSCAAFKCTNRHGKTNKEGKSISFHRFPLHNKSLCQQWIAAVRRNNFRPSVYHLICSDHFEESDYYPNYINKRKLKETAVPSIFDFPPHLKKATPPKRKPPKPRPPPPPPVIKFNPIAGPSCQEDHNYSLPSTLSKLQEKHESVLIRTSETIKRHESSIHTLRRKCERQAAKIASLESLVQNLRRRELGTEEGLEILGP